MIFAADSEAINETRFTQPALFATEYALASLWMSWGIKPQAMLGHSIGEYVAAHFAGVFSFNDALAVVAARGRLMQALQPGSMAAVHLSASDLNRWLGKGVEVAAVNASNLCTVSGPRLQSPSCWAVSNRGHRISAPPYFARLSFRDDGTGFPEFARCWEK